MLSIFIVLWVMSGILLSGKLLYDIDMNFTWNEVFLSLVAAVPGPIVLILYLYHPKVTSSKPIKPIVLQILAALLIFFTILYCTVVWLQNV